MRLYINLILIYVIAVLSVACGGSGESNSGDSSSGGNNSNGSIAIAELATISDFGIVTDIINLDLNDDGFQDLLLFRTGDTPFYSGLFIQALVNNGDRTFLDMTELYFPALSNDWKWVDKAYLTDLNGDGLLDIVGHIDEGNSGLPPLIRKSSGEFEVTTNSVLVNNKGAMIPIDSDSDGDIDILVRNTKYFGHETAQIHEWTLLQNTTQTDGELEFQSLGVVSNNAYEGWDYAAFAYAPAIIDINNDGYKDFIYGGPKYKSTGFVDEETPINVYINSTQNTFTQSATQIFSGTTPSFTHVREMITADFNSDGYQSLLIANTGYDGEPYPGQKNAILSNNGMGELDEVLGTSATHNYKGFTHSADVGDIDLDGDFDIVYTDILGDDITNSKKVRILENDGTGAFSLKSYQYLNSNNWISTKLTDLDNDGYPDLILGAIDSGSTSVIMWNDGTGNF